MSQRETTRIHSLERSCCWTRLLNDVLYSLYNMLNWKKRSENLYSSVRNEAFAVEYLSTDLSVYSKILFLIIEYSDVCTWYYMCDLCAHAPK